MVSDFQCPFCKAWHDSTYKMIQRDYVATGKIRMAFINFPLHANSLPASVTAMCAAVQGKFWGVHDRIFDSQLAWKNLERSAAVPRFARRRLRRRRGKNEIVRGRQARRAAHRRGPGALPESRRRRHADLLRWRRHAGRRAAGQAISAACSTRCSRLTERTNSSARANPHERK